MIESLNLLASQWPWWCLPLLAGTGTALLAGPLGCFVVWQRMAYFGESLAHSALLGVALGLWLHVMPIITVMACSLLLAGLLAHLKQRARFSTDTLLGILSHTLLSAGLILLAALPAMRVSLESLLFGDLLSVSMTDTLLVYLLLVLVAIMLIRTWQPLIAMTVDEQLAQAEGVPVARIRLLLMMAMAAVIAVSMKVVGVVLMTSLLIIPAAIAHRHAHSPEQMALYASITGTLAVTGGALLSWLANTPIGPAIVLLSGIFFFNSLLLGSRRD